MMVIKNFWSDAYPTVADCDKEIYSDVYTHRGNFHMKGGDDERARTDFNRAIELNPDNSDAYCRRALCYAKQGDDERAMTDFNRAIELNPDNSDVYMHRGSFYMKGGDDERARTDFNRAIELHPDDPSEYDKTILAEVTIDYGRIIELHPNDPDAYYSRGNAYLRQGWASRAIDDYDKAIELDPESAGYYRDLIDRVIEVIDRQIELNPNHPLHYHSRGDAYLRQGWASRAIDDYNKAIEVHPESAGYYRDLIDRVIELHPDSTIEP